jgi:hypothetical protein
MSDDKIQIIQEVGDLGGNVSPLTEEEEKRVKESEKSKEK